ncbi:MAG TPA: DEAD/DEAH box helicase [Gammaproteobacteria bacterium]
MSLDRFHPATAAWFRQTFPAPTGAQAQAWAAIGAGKHTLIAAPTGSGKTLAAFLSAIDGLIREGIERGLGNECHVLYISPLKALSNDVQKNLQPPLEGIRNELFAQGLPDVEVRAWVRTGDTPQAERERMRREPPHIVVTTPESLYILLTSDSGRKLLSTVKTVIVDEIHALAGNKRGAHLALSLERLAALTPKPPVRIGLSATQKPIEEVARFLTGAGQDCNVIDTGHVRKRELHLEMPRSPLTPVMAHEVWAEIYDRLAELAKSHRTTLIFSNNRRQAERVARHLAERIGEDLVTSHHGSLARAHRLDAEQRLKRGELKALVATASLELGIDIGDVDLVCQLGSPRSISTFLQRVGRSGHGVGAVPEGRIFPLSRDDLVDCTALLDSVHRGELDTLKVLDTPLDVLAQQIVAEVACREWGEAALYETFRRAWPFRDLSEKDYGELLQMLADGFSTRRGRRSAHLHRDKVNGKLRGRRGAKLIAVTNGGAIPDQFDYDVVLVPSGLRIGTLNEDFSFESIPGDIFQLGNTSYKVVKVETGRMLVEDARGQPPTIPFWVGEAPARTGEMSQAVSRLRAEADRRLGAGEDILPWLKGMTGNDVAAQQLCEYLTAARAALGTLPTQDQVIFERFFDEAGDQHFVIHSPFGARVNRAWGLSLRKRFCRKFNFELQAAALEDTIVLSLGATHSFPLEEPAKYLHPSSAMDVLTQAILQAPMFGTRWRWVATTALAVRRNRNGHRNPPAFQRADAEDLVSVVFPDQLACPENLAGAREVPDHPLVQQTLKDCMHELMDADGFMRILERLQTGELKVVARDLAAPSPLAQEILSARPYAFLDDAPMEERKTLAVQSRGMMSLEEAGSLAELDPDAIRGVRDEVWPTARDADELHDALVVLGFLTEEEGKRGNPGDALDFGWTNLFDTLRQANRAARARLQTGPILWVAAERLHEFLSVFPDADLEPALAPLTEDPLPAREDALRELVRSRLEGSGPVTAAALAALMGLASSEIDSALLALEAEGGVMRGKYTAGATETEWCERRLLARIHRYTLKRLRSEIEPVTPADYLRFLFDWHGVGAERTEGQAALAAALEQLSGFSAPASAWEQDILPARVLDYAPYMLDQLCAGGSVAWMRLVPPRATDEERRAGPVRGTPIAFVERDALQHWRTLAEMPDVGAINLSHGARAVHDALRSHGALFFSDITRITGLLRTQVEQALAELTAWGLAAADTFAGLRALITPASKRPTLSHSTRYRMRRGQAPGVDEAGRWALVPRQAVAGEGAGADAEALTHLADVLLRRYGVVFRKVLERESALPPWRDLLYIYRRLEARGEVRGGRFVDGFAGEQFALPDAVGALRETRRREKIGELVSVSAADALNLVGIVTPGQRVPVVGENRVLYQDGVPVAVQVAEEVKFLEHTAPEQEWELRNHLTRRRQPWGPRGVQ